MSRYNYFLREFEPIFFVLDQLESPDIWKCLFVRIQKELKIKLWYFSVLLKMLTSIIIVRLKKLRRYIDDKKYYIFRKICNLDNFADIYFFNFTCLISPFVNYSSYLQQFQRKWVIPAKGVFTERKIAPPSLLSTKFEIFQIKKSQNYKTTKCSRTWTSYNNQYRSFQDERRLGYFWKLLEYETENI